jgi:hypothetical protein
MAVRDHLPRVLKDKQRVITRAVFWNISHNSGREDIGLKLGRYHKGTSKVIEATPKPELTLDYEELTALVKMLQEDYEPFRQGVKAFIPLDRPYDAENYKQIKALFSKADTPALVELLIEHKVIHAELALALQQTRRVRAIQQFEAMLDQDALESKWQQWFTRNSWVLGSEFVEVIGERHIDRSNISDFLMRAYDGFLDIVEIKRPEGGLKFWSPQLDHGNPVPASDLTKALTQASRYIYEVEREANSVKFQESVGGVRTVKPRCILIFGRSKGWTDQQIEAYRILNAGFHNLTVLTYDHVLDRARRIVGLERKRGAGATQPRREATMERT